MFIFYLVLSGGELAVKLIFGFVICTPDFQPITFILKFNQSIYLK